MMTLRSQRSSGMRAIGLAEGSSNTSAALPSDLPLIGVPRLVDRVGREAFESGHEGLRLARVPDVDDGQIARQELLDLGVVRLAHRLVVARERRFLLGVHLGVLIARVVDTD